MTFSDEKLSAFLDGELAPVEMETIRLAIESDGALTAQLKKLKSPDQIITAAYGDINNEPMPQSIIGLLAPRGNSEAMDGNVVQLSHRGDASAPRWAIPLAASIALAIGIGVGLQLAPRANIPDGEAMLLAGVIDKNNPIHQILETGRSAETVSLGGEGGASMTPVLTFKSTSGKYCREFTLAANDLENRAVACRQGEEWAIQFAAFGAGENTGSGPYATALPSVNAAFDTVVDDLIGEAPLDAEEENKIILKNWRR